MPFELCREICGKKALVVVGVVTCILPGAFIFMANANMHPY